MGFIKGGLWLLCWVGAIAATYYGYPYIEPATSAWLAERDIITNALLAHLAIGTAIFLASLVFLFTVTSVLSGWVRGSQLNALDRSLGFVAGLAVAVTVVSALYIPFSATWADFEEPPSWFREARLRPVIQWTSGLVRQIIPDRPAEEGAAGEPEESASRAAEAERAFRALANPRPEAGGPKGGTGYDSGERRDMDRLFETARDR